MKKRYLMILILTVIFFLIQRPAYWSGFQKDSNRYPTDSFYYVIKEEYREDKNGERLFLPQFTDICDGDILVTDSTYCFCFRHGHAALVIDAEKGITLEAFGPGTVSKYSGLEEWRRYPHVMVLRLNASEEKKREIVRYAGEKLIGIPYRLTAGMVDDKDRKGRYGGTQCAHLIWAAFFACGYDIDGNGGWLILPKDFLASDDLYPVRQE